MAKAANEPTQQDEPKRSALGGMVWGLFSIGTTVVATKLATSVASKGWKLATGKSAPVKGDYDNEKTRDVVAYTALSSMLLATTKVAAERKAAEAQRVHRPPSQGARAHEADPRGEEAAQEAREGHGQGRAEGQEAHELSLRRPCQAVCRWAGPPA